MTAHTEEQHEEPALYEALVRFFHREIDRRYDPGYLEDRLDLQDDPIAADLPTERLEWIKQFFKRVIYPVGTGRKLRDRAMDTVVSILGHTGSLVGLLPHLPGLVFRQGARLAEVGGAAFELITGYRRANRLEERCVEEIQRLCRERDIDCSRPEEIPDTLFRSSYARLPEDETERMIEQVRKIVRLAAKPGLVDATRDVVTSVQDTRPDGEERAALDYIVSVLDEIEELSHAFSRAEIDTVIRVAEVTERRYFEELRSEN